MTRTANPFFLRRAMLTSALLNLILIGVSPLIYPTLLTASPGAGVGIAGVTTILIVYGLAGWFVPPRFQTSGVLQTAQVLGLAAGAIFAGEILLEYLLLPSDNTPFGLVEFGSVFLLWLAAGARVAFRTRRTRDGTTAAVWSAFLSSLIWLATLLFSSYLFKGTPQQAQVFRAEGNFEDFARSGMTDFEAWVMGDFLGAGFYHLLLGPAVAAVLGTLGGLAGKGLARLHEYIKTK